MGWVIGVTVACYLVVNLPTAYSALAVHGRDLGRLWGYAPNQFLFLLVVFPFAAFYTLLALRTLVAELRTQLPPSDPARVMLENWPAWVVMGFACAAIATSVVYFNSAMSLDKLRPPEARRALVAMAAVDRRLAAADASGRERLRDSLIDNATAALGRLALPSADDGQRLDGALARLSVEDPALYLQVLQNPSTQLRLRLLDPTIHALNVFQILAALLVAVVALTTAALLYHIAGRLGYPDSPNAAISATLLALTTSLFFFALYPLFYQQQRLQLQAYVGSGGTVLQQVFAAVLVIVVLFWIRQIEPSGRPIEWLIKYMPVAVLGSGFVAEIFRPQLISQLIGKDTTLGIQLLLALVTIVFGALPMIQLVWLRR